MSSIATSAVSVKPVADSPSVTPKKLPTDPASVQNRRRLGWGLEAVSAKAAQNEYQRRLLYAESDFNKRVCELLRLLRRARMLMLELAEVDVHHELRQLWRDAGLPALTADDDEGPRMMEAGEDVSRAAIGAAWAVEAYISELDGIAVGQSRESRGLMRNRRRV